MNLVDCAWHSFEIPCPSSYTHQNNEYEDLNDEYDVELTVSGALEVPFHGHFGSTGIVLDGRQSSVDLIQVLIVLIDNFPSLNGVCLDCIDPSQSDIDHFVSWLLEPLVIILVLSGGRWHFVILIEKALLSSKRWKL